MKKQQPSLLESIGQTRPFSSIGQETLVSLLKTADVIRTRAERDLEPYGLTFQQYNVLRILRGAGEPLQTMEIANRLIEHAPGMTRLLDRLEAKKLIQRERMSTDRRVVLCSLTEAGRELLLSSDAAMDKIDHTTLESMDMTDLKSLLTILADVRERFF
ncbi:MAG: MarR family transcriptional regulator ['Candidatus Kapabacteria' thiocyanatum]|uniref:HTH marR-type domain-containing protein n=1 Tax=Candidatus Kapaibacterium thiocyanatum TaxID=1895771 RepID=A0A1M3KXB9_9BACT|nr:MarR family transcriptional regulator ['Candidatus Kapabacteria' thiocyanatum]OJX57027.1 MAG: hypothetical protein BGO89_10980 ['Candidatus Kapabacteria' thiocyanatum]